MSKNSKSDRAKKYGTGLGQIIYFVLDNIIEYIPEHEKNEYKTRFIEEFKNYSFTPRKENEPINSGCVHELIDIEEIDIQTPEHLAKILKEGIHLMYNKSTAKNVSDNFLKIIEK